MGEPTLLRTPTGLSDRLNDDDELDTFDQYRQGPGERIHKALRDDSRWDKQRMVHTTPKPYHDLQDVLEVLMETGKTFDFDVSDCTWTEVIQQMEKAQDVYKAKADKNPLQRLARHGEAISALAKPALGMIPDQYGLNILRAGLAVIFQAVQQREANRIKILEAFEVIPEILAKAEKTREIYPKEESLRENVNTLYEMLLEEMPQLIRILLRKHNGFLLSRWAKQIPSQEQNFIDSSVSKINKGYAGLKNYIDTVSHKKLATIDQNITDNLRESKAIRQTAASTHVRVDRVSKDLTAVGQNLQAHREESKVQLEEIESKLEGTGQDITRNFNDKMDELRRQFQMSLSAAVETVNTNHATTIQTGIYYIVLEKVYYQGYQQPHVYRSPTPTYQRVSTSAILGILDVPLDDANADLGYVLRQSNNFKTDALGHGRWLMTTNSFKNWLAGGRPGILLVDGHCDQAKIGKTSPMSVFCANFIASVVKLQSSIVLHFFCGQHVKFNDHLRGPHGLLRSLICQLLLYPRSSEPNLEMLSEDRLYKDLTEHSLSALRHLFQQLVQQIPTGTLVFCIIDGLSEYETRMNNSMEGLRYIVEGLQSIVHDQQQGGPTLKVLMTSASKSTEIVKQIPLEERVSLRAGNVHSGPVSEQAFLAEVSKAKASVEAATAGCREFPWTESNLPPGQAVLGMSRLRIEGAPATPEPLPWSTLQRVQTLVGAEMSPLPAPQPWTTQPPPTSQNYSHQYE